MHFLGTLKVNFQILKVLNVLNLNPLTILIFRVANIFVILKKAQMWQPWSSKCHFCIKNISKILYPCNYFKYVVQKGSLIFSEWKYWIMGFSKGWANFLKHCIFSFCGVLTLIHNSLFLQRQLLDLSNTHALCEG